MKTSKLQQRGTQTDSSPTTDAGKASTRGLDGLSPVEKAQYRSFVDAQVKELRDLTLAAALSPSGSAAYEAMIEALKRLPRQPVAPTVNIPTPAEWFDAVKATHAKVQSLTQQASLAPGALRASEDILAALSILLRV